MRLLLDESVGVASVERLNGLGHDAVHIAQTVLSGAGDEAIHARALAEGRVLVTRDHHFTNPIRFPTRDTPGTIYLRKGNLTSAQEAELLARFVTDVDPSLVPGSLVSLSPHGTTIRVERPDRTELYTATWEADSRNVLEPAGNFENVDKLPGSFFFDVEKHKMYVRFADGRPDECRYVYSLMLHRVQKRLEIENNIFTRFGIGKTIPYVYFTYYYPDVFRKTVAMDHDLFDPGHKKGVAHVRFEREGIERELWKGDTLEDWRRLSGCHKHTLCANPQFVAPQDGDCRLRPDSPAAGVGEGGRNLGGVNVAR